MSDLAYRLLTEDELSAGLEDLPGWIVEDDLLTKVFGFAQYLEGARFAMRVAETADKLNHHPDMLIQYDAVVISVNTHDVGGLSPYDLELARRIEAI